MLLAYTNGSIGRCTFKVLF